MFHVNYRTLAVSGTRYAPKRRGHRYATSAKNRYVFILRCAYFYIAEDTRGKRFYPHLACTRCHFWRSEYVYICSLALPKLRLVKTVLCEWREISRNENGYIRGSILGERQMSSDGETHNRYDALCQEDGRYNSIVLITFFRVRPVRICLIHSSLLTNFNHRARCFCEIF